MRIEVRDVGRGAHVEARAIAGERTFRAPHHTVSQAGLVGELAISAGGVLMLDEADQFSRTAMLGLRNTLALMADGVRPVLFLTVPGGELTPRLREQLEGLPDGPPAAVRAAWTGYMCDQNGPSRAELAELRAGSLRARLLEMWSLLSEDDEGRSAPADRAALARGGAWGDVSVSDGDVALFVTFHGDDREAALAEIGPLPEY